MRYAGFWKRFVAIFIDSIIIYSFESIIFGFGANVEVNDLAALIIGWLYFAIHHSSKRQATVGKMIMGIIVTDINEKRINFATATARYFAKLLSALILMFGYIMAAFTEKKQALHDKLANTLVINNK